MNTRTAKITVVGKEISTGFFGGKKYQVIVNVEGKTNPLPVVLDVPVEQYYHLKEGNEYSVVMYQYSDGRWYFQP